MDTELSTDIINEVYKLRNVKSLNETAGQSLIKLSLLDPEWIVKQYKERSDKDSVIEFSNSLHDVGIIREVSLVIYNILKAAIKDTEEIL